MPMTAAEGVRVPSAQAAVYPQPMKEYVVTRLKVEAVSEEDWLHPPKSMGDDDTWELHSWNVAGGVMYAVWSRMRSVSK